MGFSTILCVYPVVIYYVFQYALSQLAGSGTGIQQVGVVIVVNLAARGSTSWSSFQCWAVYTCPWIIETYMAVVVLSMEVCTVLKGLIELK